MLLDDASYVVKTIARGNKKQPRPPKAIRTQKKRRLGVVRVTVPVTHPLATFEAETKMSPPFEQEGRMVRRVEWRSQTDRMEIISRI